MMDMIVAWLCYAIAELFQDFTSFFSTTFGYDISVFNSTFTFAGKAYNVIVETAIAVTLLISAWQLIVFFWKGSDRGSDPPIRIVVNTALALGFIFLGNYLLEMIIDFCKYPYEALDKIDAVKWGTELDWGNMVTDLLFGAFGGYSMVLYLVLLLLICFNMAKLLLEIVERYVVAFIMIYLSPAVSSTLASTATSGIYKKYFMMFISQCVLIFLNSWCLRMACSGLNLAEFEKPEALIIPFLLCYGFLRVSTKMDSYLNQIGLNAAITGSGLGAEILGAGATLVGYGSSNGGSGTLGKGGGAGSVLGAMNTAQKWINRVNPISAAGGLAKDTVVGAATGISEAYRTGRNIFATAANKQPDDAPPVSMVNRAGYAAKQSDNLISRAGFGHAGNNKLTEEVLNSATGHENRNIQSWSENPHLAQKAYKHVQSMEVSSDGAGSERIVTAPDHVAAVMKGLGIGNMSEEAAAFIQAGFGTENTFIDTSDGTKYGYRLDKNGIRATFDTRDGYRHSLKMYDRGQYVRLSAKDRDGLEMHTAPDGRRYYVGMSKTKMDNFPRKKEEDQKE